MEELISVIIPIYNVEKYLDRCLKSVCDQSYRKLEILLVDDGATDGSGAIADRWAAEDPRIRVIHQLNQGLSGARNTGIDAAAGSFIVFLDSDDYADTDMIRKLYKSVSETGADMAIGRYETVDESGKTVHIPGKKPEEWKRGCQTGRQALRELAVSVSGFPCTIPAWNRLVRTDIQKQILFPVGKLHEDEFVVHRLLGMCRRIAYLEDVTYFYVQREGSITATRTARSLLHTGQAYMDRALYGITHGNFWLTWTYGTRGLKRFCQYLGKLI